MSSLLNALTWSVRGQIPRTRRKQLMPVAVAVKPLRRRTLVERMAMSPEEELELLIAEQEADDTFYVDRHDGEISLDAPAPNHEGTIGELLYRDEAGSVVVPSIVSSSRGGRSSALGSSRPLADAVHGTLYAYRRLKCKCRPCTKANSTYMAAYRAKKKSES